MATRESIQAAAYTVYGLRVGSYISLEIRIRVLKELSGKQMLQKQIFSVTMLDFIGFRIAFSQLK